MNSISTAISAVCGAVATLVDYTVHKIATHKSAPRVFVETRRIARAGFEPGVRYTIELDPGERRLTLRVSEAGAYMVSRRQREGAPATPVLDLNSNELLGIFEGHSAVRMVVMAGAGVIYFLPLATSSAVIERAARVRDKLVSGAPLATASICAGAGFMAYALAKGYEQGGIRTAPAVVNEIDSEQVEHALQHNPAVAGAQLTLAAPLQEVALDPWLMARVPKVEIAELSLPCSGASAAGKAKRGTDVTEEHPEVGHLIAPAIMLLHRLQPAVVVVENVVPYRNSGSAWILRHTLRDMGYSLSEVELDGVEFGQLEARRRWFLVAATAGLSITLDDLVPQLTTVPRVEDVLEEVAADDPRWSGYAYLFTKQVRDEAKGNGFMMQTVKPGDSKVPTLRKGYHKGGSTDPLLVHPDRNDLFRKFTGTEHARIKGFPADLVTGLSQTRAHELLGQSVLYAPLAAIGRRIGEALQAFARNSAVPQGIGYRLERATG